MTNKNYYYNESEWNRLGCGPLPEERKYPEIDPNQYLLFPEDDGTDAPKNPYAKT